MEIKDTFRHRNSSKLSLSDENANGVSRFSQKTYLSRIEIMENIKI